MGEKALTISEVIVAAIICAMAIVPIWGLVAKRAIENDYSASHEYAANKASEILSALLDDVPFSFLQAGNPGLLGVCYNKESDKALFYNDEWLEKTASSLFPGAKKTTHGYMCKGNFVDGRGISYTAHLKIEDVGSFGPLQPPETENIGELFPDAAPQCFPERNELTFSYLKAPSIISDSNWFQKYSQNPSETPFVETQLTINNAGVAEPLINVYEQKSSDRAPYGYINPTAFRLTQRGAAKQAGLPEKFKGQCLMKKLILQVQWKLDSAGFSLHKLSNDSVCRLHLMTLKADLD